MWFVQRYVLQGSRWRVTDLTYRISKYPSDSRWVCWSTGYPSILLSDSRRGCIPTGYPRILQTLVEWADPQDIQVSFLSELIYRISKYPSDSRWVCWPRGYPNIRHASGKCAYLQDIQASNHQTPGEWADLKDIKIAFWLQVSELTYRMFKYPSDSKWMCWPTGYSSILQTPSECADLQDIQVSFRLQLSVLPTGYPSILQTSGKYADLKDIQIYFRL